MSQTRSSSTQQVYGLARVCRAWEVARSTVYAAWDARFLPLRFLQVQHARIRSQAGASGGPNADRGWPSRWGRRFPQCCPRPRGPEHHRVGVRGPPSVP
jgi:hypothetical protein